MPDDLSPAEQARAARWSVEWLEDHGWLDQPADASRAMLALRIHADTVDSPESVESLRAERDAALQELAESRAAQDEGLAEVEELIVRLAVTRAEVARLRATHTEAEAARGRCPRED